MPLWLLATLFAASFAVVGLGAYFVYRHFRGDAALSTKSGQLSPPSQLGGAASATPGMKALMEAVEVTGFRLLESRDKKTEAVFLVVNHSAAPLTDLSGTVTLRPSTAKKGSELVGIFAFEHLSLGPFESRELRAPLNTTLRTYELPDWEYLRTELSLSSPSAKP